ncbi:MAG TPA: 3-isopropylmalate dehydrogenase, partial [Gammaproteobacteria bacterium]|nr:3-isopropylmalate dehydrogenase [Gammaproteobacteria bacterium]
PEKTLALCERADAILLGAVGGPKWANVPVASRPEQGLLDLRRALRLFANLRPTVSFPEIVDSSPLRADRLVGVDIIIVRELTGGIYFGKRGRTATAAFDTCEYSVGEIERICRVAGRLAQQRRHKVTSVDKANVLDTSRLWRETATRLFAEEFPDLTLEHLYVDAAAMHLLSRPTAFDVMVMDNMFGDILTDEASMLAGSLGLLPSASINESQLGLYEPIHGSAPDIAGRDIANPIGAILSVAMLFRHSLGAPEAAAAVENAVHTCLRQGYRTADIARPGAAGVGTSAFGDAVLAALGS